MSSASNRVHSNIYSMVTKEVYSEVGIKGGPRSASNLKNTVQGEDVHLAAIASNLLLPRFLLHRGSKLRFRAGARDPPRGFPPEQLDSPSMLANLQRVNCDEGGPSSRCPSAHSTHSCTHSLYRYWPRRNTSS